MGRIVLATVLGVCVLAGCAHDEPVRVSDPDAGGPIVNPKAPGANDRRAGAASTQELTAEPGMKTGIPK